MSTERDKAILNSILNPFLPVGTDFDVEDSSSLNDAIGEITNEVLEAKRIEKEGIVLAEDEKVLDAIKAFSKAIEIAPHLPSLYNNRAQAYRLNNDIINALNDLNTAILLSRGTGRSGCQAFCQRGLILKKNGEEEKALEDFKKAADLGSPFAKMVLVQSNPYAALCNKMLSQNETCKDEKKAVSPDKFEETAEVGVVKPHTVALRINFHILNLTAEFSPAHDTEIAQSTSNNLSTSANRFTQQ